LDLDSTAENMDSTTARLDSTTALVLAGPTDLCGFEDTKRCVNGFYSNEELDFATLHNQVKVQVHTGMKSNLGRRQTQVWSNARTWKRPAARDPKRKKMILEDQSTTSS